MAKSKKDLIEITPQILEYIEIFKETTTIGIRRVEMERTVLKREIKKVQTVYGEALVKVCMTEGQTRYYPEYESVVKICREKGLPYPEVYEKIAEQCR